MKNKRRKFSRINWIKSRKTPRNDFFSAEFSLNQEEILAGPPEARGSYNFLGYFPPGTIDRFLKERGVYRKLETLGFRDLILTVDTHDVFRQRLAIHSQSVVPQNLLAEVVLKRQYLQLKSPFPSAAANQNFEFLAVEWLCLQNPRKTFSPELPRLPGQTFPGLGMGKLALEFFAEAAQRMKLAGILNVPEYFHNSQIYSRRMNFLDPVSEGKRMALARDLLGELSLAELSWAIDRNCVQENSKPFTWFTSPQIFPLDPRLIQYFRLDAYRELASATSEAFHYRLRPRKWKQVRPTLPLV